jgi:hypothetical protein
MYKIVWGLGMAYLPYSISKYEKEIPRFARDDSSFGDIKGGRSGDSQVNC